MNNVKRSVGQIVAEGHAAVEREKGRTLPSVAHHYWLDDKIRRYRSEFDWAKRLVFLAMRSIEYEFQESLPLRWQILTAENPDELEAAVRELQREQAGRTINRKRPEEASVVLSLRDDILSVSDSTGSPYGERRWSASRKFRERLWERTNAIFDDNGKYLGQGVRFAFPERGALDLRCAERLWRVSATIQGDLLDVKEPHGTMLLMKSNTFESKWCEGRGPAGETKQSATIRPTSQLFRGSDQGGTESTDPGYTAAFLSPWFNVRRSDFYREQYQEGSSEELAGRGLYGEYILLFPYPGLLEPAVDFPLENVEDVLIRFDYLSVDNLPRL